MQDEGDKLREVYGVVADNDISCFDQHKLKEIWARPHVNHYGTPKHIIVGIDTNSGKHKTSSKTTSKFAMVSFIKNIDHNCIVGLENLEARVPDDYTDQMIHHVRELQRRFPHSQLVAIVDGMLAMDGGVIQREFRRNMVNDVIFVATGDGKPGVLILPETKRDFMITTNDVINRDEIAFHKEITTSSKDLPKLKEEFLDQMCKFSEIKKRPKEDDEEYKPVNVYFTGKLTKGMCDDLCVCFQMSLYYHRYFMNSPKYAKYRI